MGLRRAAVALGTVGGALLSGSLASPPRKQLACVHEAGLKNTIPRAGGSGCFMDVAMATDYCCSGKKGKWNYFAIGGTSKFGHHNRHTCVVEIEQLLGTTHKHRVPDDRCDVGCPSANKDFNTANGLCGGGCEGCGDFTDGEKCYGKKEKGLECGVYWSVYSCDASEETLPEIKPYKKPVACRKKQGMSGVRMRGPGLEEKHVRSFCCDHHGAKYYSIGGHGLIENKPVHHAFSQCFDDKNEVLTKTGEADYDMCDVGCPGRDDSFDKTEWGVCGGGCKDCQGPATCPAQRSRDAQCGLYWAVYSCDGKEQPWVSTAATHTKAPWAKKDAPLPQRPINKWPSPRPTTKPPPPQTYPPQAPPPAARVPVGRDARQGGETLPLPEQVEALQKGLTGTSLAVSNAVEDAMEQETST